jgi:hypothetical protein
MNSHNEIFCYVELCPSQCPRDLSQAQRYISAAKESWVNILFGI